MAVTILISDESDFAPLVFEDDDPAYWHLFPYFERAFNKTGEMVDLHGDAEFKGEQLQAFLLVLEDAKRDALVHDNEWMVTVGSRTSGPIQQSLARVAILRTVASLKSMLDRAYNDSLSVLCIGD